MAENQVISFNTALWIIEAFNLAVPLGGILSVPLTGYILNSQPSYVSFGLLFVISVASSIVSLVDDANLQIVTICLFAFIRGLFYSATSSLLSRFFGTRIFGSVYGMVLSIAALACLLHYPIMVEATKAQSYRFTDGIFLTIFILWGLFPVILYKRFNKI